MGLANALRPGLGTRAAPASGKGSRAKGKTKAIAAGARAKAKLRRPRTNVRHDAEPLGRVAPLPPTGTGAGSREAPADLFAREQERDTGVSGHSSGD